MKVKICASLVIVAALSTLGLAATSQTIVPATDLGYRQSDVESAFGAADWCHSTSTSPPGSDCETTDEDVPSKQEMSTLIKDLIHNLDDLYILIRQMEPNQAPGRDVGHHTLPLLGAPSASHLESSATGGMRWAFVDSLTRPQLARVYPTALVHNMADVNTADLLVQLLGNMKPGTSLAHGPHEPVAHSGTGALPTASIATDSETPDYPAKLTMDNIKWRSEMIPQLQEIILDTTLLVAGLNQQWELVAALRQRPPSHSAESFEAYNRRNYLALLLQLENTADTPRSLEEKVGVTADALTYFLRYSRPTLRIVCAYAHGFPVAAKKLLMQLQQEKFTLEQQAECADNYYPRHVLQVVSGSRLAIFTNGTALEESNPGVAEYYEGNRL
ncbi:hypothetical protein IWQ60_003907 [Tieghemiomyces parasiticus]|uniref:Uncharacterized protein n=1 Tax=Tieghemiomyces parasiticus TaxID=78921 RepID=A0A9W8A8S7_9FUNG|nr:hypothetical protein IWQ60_003907 [Tieghemiomyces parasiticus]